MPAQSSEAFDMLEESVLSDFDVFPLLEDQLVVEAVLGCPAKLLTDVIPILIRLQQEMRLDSSRKSMGDAAIRNT